MERRDFYFFLSKLATTLLGKLVKYVEYIHVCVWDSCCDYENFEQDNAALPYQMPQKCLALKEVDSSG